MKTRSYLYEGLDKSSKQSMMLWESVGKQIAEAQLTVDQISQLFQQVEKDATAAGVNRTAIGSAKDAWTDLKSKIYDSAPMSNFAQAYDQAAEKLKQATGGDQGAMKYVQKYRDFATKHPILQSFVYGALIAAAGVSGAGAGGAAALGLFKSVDQLLQGKDIRSAVWSGAKTGGLAYGASKLGDLIRDQGQTTTTTNYQSSTVGMQPANPWDIPDSFKQRYPVDQFVYKSDGMDYYEIFDKAGNKVANFDTSNMLESFVLTNEQINNLFESIIIEAGLWSKFSTQVLGEPEEIKKTAQYAKDVTKQAASKAAGWVGKQAQRIGHNITNKVTADKLQKAWKSAGSPTDSEAIKDLIVAQGIDAGIVDNSLKALNVATTDRSRLPDINKMTKQQLQQLLTMLEQPVRPAKAHTGGRVAGQPLSQTPNAIRQRNARAAKKTSTTASVVEDYMKELKQLLNR